MNWLNVAQDTHPILTSSSLSARLAFLRTTTSDSTFTKGLLSRRQKPAKLITANCGPSQSSLPDKTILSSQRTAVSGVSSFPVGPATSYTLGLDRSEGDSF